MFQSLVTRARDLARGTTFAVKIDTAAEIYAAAPAAPAGKSAEGRTSSPFRDPINRKVIPFDPFWRRPMEMRLMSFYRIRGVELD